MAYTTITDPSAYFQTTLYTGNETARTITNDGNSDLQPDFVWIKKRSNTGSHSLYDSTRGGDLALQSNVNTAEVDDNSQLTGFSSDGFTLGNESGASSQPYPTTNSNNQTYVAWQWKDNGGTTASNSSGSITSTVQANTTAGFSIVTYTGNGSSGATVGHGLGTVPDTIILKCRNATENWFVNTPIAGGVGYMMLNQTNADSGANSSVWNSTTPTSTLFTLGNSGGVNGNNNTYVAYCFKSIQGYSKFGSYTGNGDSDGPFVYTGFKPRFFMLKGTGNISSWCMYDTARDPINRASQKIWANEYNAEQSTGAMDFLSNGIKMRINDNDFNGSGYQYRYMAFAENPLVATNGVPTTAR